MVFMTRVLCSKLEFTAGGGNFDLQQQERTGRQMRTNVKAASDPRYCKSGTLQTQILQTLDIANPKYCKLQILQTLSIANSKCCRPQIRQTPGNAVPKYRKTPDIAGRYPSYGQGGQRWQAFGEYKK